MSKEIRYTMELSAKQLRIIAICVEDCHRFLAGDLRMNHICRVLDRTNETRRALAELKPLVTPYLGPNEEYDWRGSDCPNDPQRRSIAETYAIYREIKHSLCRSENSVYHTPTLTCDEGGELPIIKKIEQ